MWFSNRARLLSDIAGGLILSSEGSLDFHTEIWLVSPTILKNL